MTRHWPLSLPVLFLALLVLGVLPFNSSAEDLRRSGSRGESFLEPSLASRIHPRSYGPGKTGVFEAEEREVWTVSRKMLLLNGKPFFPYGIFYTSFRAAEQEQRLRDLPLLAATGFNVVNTPVSEQDRIFLSRLKEYGIALAAETNSGLSEEEFLGFLEKNHFRPAFYTSHDDIDSQEHGQRKYPPGEACKRIQGLKALLPGTVISWSGGHPTRILDYLSCSGVLAQQQLYPVPAEALASVSLDYLNTLVSALDESQREISLVANAQSFAWEGKRFPSVAEMRNIAYQSVVQGVKGIVWYTFYDRLTHLRDRPDVLQALKNIGEELKSIAPFLLLGEHQIVSTEREHLQSLFAARWTLDTYSLFVVVNAHERLQNEFFVPGVSPFLVQTGKVKYLRTNTGQALSESGRLRLQPLEVAIFGFSEESS